MVDCVAFSPDGGSIASTARDDFTRAWAWQTEEEWKEAQAAATAEAAKKAAMCGKAAAPASPVSNKFQSPIVTGGLCGFMAQCTVGVLRTTSGYYPVNVLLSFF